MRCRKMPKTLGRCENPIDETVVKFAALRDFLAVVERGSLRAAARELGVAQPTITRNIQELEKELGVALFERGARGVKLTAMGQAFLRRATAVRGELQRAREEIDQLRGQAHGTVTVGLSSASQIALLPHALSAFRARFADVRLNVIDSVLPNLEAGLIDGSVDLYVGPVPPEVARELQVEKLFDNARVVLARKGHPLGAAKNLRELVDAEWITTSITRKAEEELGPLFAEHGLPAPRLAMRAQSSMTLLVTLACTDLLTVLPVQWLNFTLLRDVMQPIPVREVLRAPPICLVHRSGLPLTPAAECFADMMRRSAVQQQRLVATLTPRRR